MTDQPPPLPDPNQPDPTLGRNAGFHVDELGNITGIWFSVRADHVVEYIDQAIDLRPGATCHDEPAA